MKMRLNLQGVTKNFNLKIINYFTKLYMHAFAKAKDKIV